MCVGVAMSNCVCLCVIVYVIMCVGVSMSNCVCLCVIVFVYVIMCVGVCIIMCVILCLYVLLALPCESLLHQCCAVQGDGDGEVWRDHHHWHTHTVEGWKGKESGLHRWAVGFEGVGWQSHTCLPLSLSLLPLLFPTPPTACSSYCLLLSPSTAYPSLLPLPTPLPFHCLPLSPSTAYPSPLPPKGGLYLKPTKL